MQERLNIENLKNKFRRPWEVTGVSVVFESWTDAQTRSLINFMVISSHSVIFFLKQLMHQKLMKIHIYRDYFCKFLKKWVYPE